MRLRGHHLVCLHFYRGEGYSEAFVSHLTGLIGRAEGGEPVEVVAGPDDLCRACPWLKHGVCVHREGAEAEIQEMDEAALALLGLKPGAQVTWEGLRERLPGLMPVWRERFCRACEWRAVCLGQQAGGA